MTHNCLDCKHHLESSVADVEACEKCETKVAMEVSMVDLFKTRRRCENLTTPTGWDKKEE